MVDNSNEQNAMKKEKKKWQLHKYKFTEHIMTQTIFSLKVSTA